MNTQERHNRIAECCQRLRLEPTNLVSVEAELRRTLDRIEMDLVRIGENDPETGKLIQPIRNRLARLHELRRTMELGSLSIEIARVVDTIWRRLP